MMEKGDRVVWVSGDGRVMSRGIWGLGHVTGAVDTAAVEPSVPVDIPLFASALTDADLRVAGVDDLEVQRMPAGSNPSWVSKEQWGASQRCWASGSAERQMCACNGAGDFL